MATHSGLFTGYADGGVPVTVTSAFPAFARGSLPGYSGFGGGFPGFLRGGGISGIFTGYALGPATYQAVGAFTGYTLGGGHYAASHIPAVAWCEWGRASGSFPAFARGYGATAGYLPASGLFTGWVHRTTSTAIPAVAFGPLPRVSGQFPGYALGAVRFSGVFPAAVPTVTAPASGAFVAFASGY